MVDMKLEKEILRYSKNNGYPISEYNAITCSCGAKELYLCSDDEEGGAYVVCPKCNLEQNIENSCQHIEQAYNNICTCDNEKLMVGVGKAYYADSHDTRWVYVGAQCNRCDLVGVYADWSER